ncbi:Twinkle like protein, chloroplastic/mitochondrial [Apostasia shenzhenica]|uniref:Twinkle like protein, chloroplastic/mitochondrial n=1 Tax=Apostasia shenzhenica TaxID=1088818 RepID=A0A2I0A9Q0_9ASPA|nr:Twinkle like protein, chloroplastic/mitochondrial [Apostasia shenzhenica]
MPALSLPMLPKALLRSLLVMPCSRHLLELFSCASVACPAYSNGLHYHALPVHCFAKQRRNMSKTVCFSLKFSGFRSYSPLPSSRTVRLERREDEEVRAERHQKLQEKLAELGIECDNYKAGEYMHELCPQCKGGYSKVKSFSLFIREDGKLATWSCFKVDLCGWRGRIECSENGEGFKVEQSGGSSRALEGKRYRTISESGLKLEPLCPELIAFFKRRCISAETLRRNAVMQCRTSSEVVIAFTYRKAGKLVSCKYRTVDKKFWQEKDTEKIFYGLEDILPGCDIIIVEGEIDKLSMEEAGFRNCVSVPNGAVGKVSEKVPSEVEDKGFQYLWTCKEYLDKAPRIILATDADGPGQALAEELARRLGKERCWRVNWPAKSGSEVCKDANEVLTILGKDALKEVIEKAELFPIRGLFNFSNFFHEINNYYQCNQGFELGVSTGWRALDDFYNIVPGELSVITGVPNSGKSEWIDALLCNINEKHGWTFALCSMENKVQEHARKLLEKHIKKPFFTVRYGESIERMSPEELEEGKKWLNATFHVIRCDDDALPSVDWVLNLAKAAVLRNGVRGLVIDPYNELDHQRPTHQTETEYVSQMLTKIKRFAQHHSCHVWFVAHPRQLHNWGGGAPNLYDISGSAHFINKCDNGIVIHRNRDVNEGPLDRVQVFVRKVRNKVIGRIGDAFLQYDRVTGRFNDIS